MKVLYISYDGMTDSLGQSQVIPYLNGLVKEGHEVHVLSCEKERNFKENQDTINMILFNSGIHWHPVMYTKKPPVLSTFYDVIKLKRKAAALERRLHFDVVHCRSYIAALVGQYLKRMFGVKFLFDIRGFWADERVDGGLWDLSKFSYKKIYTYFKKKEKSFFEEADAIVTLTNASKTYINKTFQPQANVNVIPCAADITHFVEQTEEVKLNARSKLGLHDEFVLLYLGSIGTWYLLSEMLDFFLCLKQKKSDAKFVFITGDEPFEILSAARKKGIPDSDIIVKSAKRSEVPALISVADLSVFFIKPCFSKMASSPTKHGELLASNVPVVCNDIGDLKEIISQYGAGIIVDDLEQISYQKALTTFFEGFDKSRLKETAEHYYSLEKGIISYDLIYRTLI